MFGIGFSEMIIGGVVLAFIAVTVISRRGRLLIAGPTLVLQKFNVNEKAADGLIIDIDGRAGGVMSWFLTVVGFDAVTSLKVTATEITFKSSSLFGQKHSVTPLTSIAHTECGYSKPIGFLIVGGLIIFMSLFSLKIHGTASDVIFPMLFLLVGIALIFCYWLLKKMIIAIETYGGSAIGLTFKRSVIENVSVDIEKAIEAIRLINKNILKAQGMQNAAIEATYKAPGVCTKCGHQNSPEDTFCVGCGTKLRH